MRTLSREKWGPGGPKKSLVCLGPIVRGWELVLAWVRWGNAGSRRSNGWVTLRGSRL